MHNFTHLHVHSQYSLLDGQASIKGLVDKAIADGMKGIALTDHGNMFGIKEFWDYSSEKRKEGHDFMPILGCEMYVANRSRFDKETNIDNRGSFTEFLKSADRGQVSVNISKPHITKGNHWHHTKNEKFLVVSGKGVIRFRKIDSDKVIEYPVSGDKLEIVDIPVGYTHNIENLGDTDMVTIMWVNEIFNKENPDTFFLAVGN